MWPGYATSLSTFQSGVLFCVNPTNKFVMEQSALDVIRNNRGPNMKEMIAKELVHRGVMTRYNKRIYRVEDIDYDQNPMNTFMMRKLVRRAR